MKVTIIDYGVGNIFSVCSAIKKVGHEPFLTKKENDIKKSDLVILPGVGSFDKAAEQLKKNSLDYYLKDYILLERPILGICVGMQLMMSYGEEGEGADGLDLFKGKVKKLKTSGSKLKKIPIPHIAWAKIHNNETFKERNLLQEDDYMYFVHSYNCELENMSEVSSYSFYGGIKLTSSIQKKNICGVQFHPEKSGKSGLKFLKNYIEK